MLICDNGIYRDATPEEIKAFENTPYPGTEDPDVQPEDYEQVLADLGVRLS